MTRRVYHVKKNTVYHFLPYNLHLFLASDKMNFSEENHIKTNPITNKRGDHNESYFEFT
jgi:hypothetical protein